MAGDKKNYSGGETYDNIILTSVMKIGQLFQKQLIGGTHTNMMVLKVPFFTWNVESRLKRFKENLQRIDTQFQTPATAYEEKYWTGQLPLSLPPQLHNSSHGP
jgi:hypothetical protein